MEKRPYKDLSELTLMDDYMFGAVMQDPKLAKPLIEFILDVKLIRIEYAEPQKAMKEGYSARGIRLDLYVEDEDGQIYNVEVQSTRKQNLPKRMRYYQSIIDLHILTPGAYYSKLRKSFVIFICNYDPFGKKRILYRFENRCVDDPELVFGDETVKVVVNTKGTEGTVTDELRELIRYLDDGTISGGYSQELEDAVRGVKNSEERRREYMVMMAKEIEIREEGREEGLTKGRAEGEGLMATLITKLKDLNRPDDAFRAASDPEYRQQLYREFKPA